MQTQQWSLQDAKNKLSAVVDAAQQGEAQIVTRRGVPSAVVISVEAFDKLQQQEELSASHFIEHLLSGPRADTIDSLAGSLFEHSDLTSREVSFTG